MSEYPQRLEVLDPFGDGLTDRCELPTMGTGSQAKLSARVVLLLSFFSFCFFGF